MQRICVYCGSSSGINNDYAEAARDLAGVLVRHGIELVYGGAAKGIMGILSDAVLERGGAVHGVIPKLLQEKEIAHCSISTAEHIRKLREKPGLIDVQLKNTFNLLNKQRQYTIYGNKSFLRSLYRHIHNGAHTRFAGGFM
jgi:hypothetical protein